MFINDINYFISPSKCVLFADDTTLITSHKNFAQLDALLATFEKKVESWFTVDKLKLNNNETQKLFISSNHIHTQGNEVKLECLSKSLPSTIFLIRQLNSVVDMDTVCERLLRRTVMKLCLFFLSIGINVVTNDGKNARVLVVYSPRIPWFPWIGELSTV